MRLKSKETRQEQTNQSSWSWEEKKYAKRALLYREMSLSPKSSTLQIAFLFVNNFLGAGQFPFVSSVNNFDVFSCLAAL